MVAEIKLSNIELLEEIKNAVEEKNQMKIEIQNLTKSLQAHELQDQKSKTEINCLRNEIKELIETQNCNSRNNLIRKK